MGLVWLSDVYLDFKKSVSEQMTVAPKRFKVLCLQSLAAFLNCRFLKRVH